MQFHLNGFEPGDPDIHPPGDATPATLADELDVLIVGCGPAGLTLAAQLSGFDTLRSAIVEQKPGPMEKGQADGVSCRTMEMFQAFGFADKVKREAYWVNETSFWNPTPERPQDIQRTGRVQDVQDGLSEMPHVILNQARIHDYYLDIMRHAPTRMEPYYSRRLVDLTVAEDGSDHPVLVTLETTQPDGSTTSQTVRARYVVGCDGARSAVRGSIGRDFHGTRAHQPWGVMDVLAVTDFPDIRLKTLIKSADQGSILIIPREGGYMVRIYIELDKLAPDQRISATDMSVDRLIEATNRVLHPYRLDVKQVAWWSVYEVGHRLTDKFDNVAPTDMDSTAPRVFIAGDACHTHSAKAGQGMNVSMGDTFNLGWKLVSVLLGRSADTVLHSYSAERHRVAQDLIDFDLEWSRIMSTPPAPGASEQETARFQQFFVEHGRYTAGLSVKYAPSLLTGAPHWQHLATGFEIGTRFHSAPVIRLADARPMQLGHVITADCAWRVFAFAGAGDAGQPGGGIAALCDFLGQAPTSPLRVHTPAGGDPDCVIDLRAVFQQGHQDLEVGALPDLLTPAKGRFGLRDAEKVFCVDPRRGNIFRMRGIDAHKGCLVIVRPDQYVAHILPLDAFDDLAAFFDGFLTRTPRG